MRTKILIYPPHSSIEVLLCPVLPPPPPPPHLDILLSFPDYKLSQTYQGGRLLTCTQLSLCDLF